MNGQPPSIVPDLLRSAAETYEERNKTYGNNYKKFGDWTSKLFPDGIRLKTPSDFNRLGVLIQILSKLSRYVENFEKGGHDDSLQDLVVYATMLRELDTEQVIANHEASKTQIPLP